MVCGTQKSPSPPGSACSLGMPRLPPLDRSLARSGERAPIDDSVGYLMPTTMESGPARCSTRVSRKPASPSQAWQSAPV
jgi:hypothetical protein